MSVPPTPEEIRLECLRLAIGIRHSGARYVRKGDSPVQLLAIPDTDPVKEADRMAKFVLQGRIDE